MFFLQWTINRINFDMVIFLLQLFTFFMNNSWNSIQENKTKQIQFLNLLITWPDVKKTPTPQLWLICTNKFIYRVLYTDNFENSRCKLSAQCLFYFEKSSRESIPLQNLCQSCDQWNLGLLCVWALNRAVFISQVILRHHWSNFDKL